jgi:hypothetical protein
MLTLNRTEVIKIRNAVSVRGLELMSTICQWEIEGPHVLDETCFESFVARRSVHLEEVLRRLYLIHAVAPDRLRLPRMDDRMIVYVGNRAQVAIENFKMLIRNLDPDLTAVLRAIAHLEASYKRIGQAFRLLVWNELCLKYAAELRENLEANLGLTGPDGQAICERLSLQTAAARERREAVKTRIIRLTGTIRSLEQLERVEIGLLH